MLANNTHAYSAANDPQPTIGSNVLQSGGGGGTFDNMDIVDAKIAAAEARTDAKITDAASRIETSLASINEKLSHMPTNTTMLATVAGFAAAVFGAVVAVLSFAGDRFDGGMALGSNAAQALTSVESIKQENAAQTKQIQELNGKLDQVIKAIADDRQTKENPEVPAPFGGTDTPKFAQ